MAERIKIETVKTNGFSMDHFKFGHGKDTLVILPGLSVQSVMGLADSIAEAYRPTAEGRTVYVFDRRKDLPDRYSVYDMAHDTADAAAALGLDRFCVFGASQGGMIAMTMAIERPQTVQKLILGSSCARVTEAGSRTVESWIRLAKDGDAAGLYLAFGEAVYPRELFERSRELLTEASHSVTADDLRRFTVLAEGMNGFDVTERLKEITCPVLIVGSNDDRVLGADAAAEIARSLNGRTKHELFMYDGFGHAAYDTAPDYKERILRFING